MLGPRPPVTDATDAETVPTYSSAYVFHDLGVEQLFQLRSQQKATAPFQNVLKIITSMLTATTW